MLMAEGFVTVKALASKFFYLYSLLKALLSAQLHCSRGLRAIMSVLIVAGGVKRADPELAEDALLMRALAIVCEHEVIFVGSPRKHDESLES